MRAISSMATRHLLGTLAARATDAGLGALEIESVGGVDAARRVAAGEPFDLVFLAADALERLATAGHVDAASVTPIAVSQVAVAVPGAGSAEGPAFPDAAGVRAALQAAGRIGYSTGPSGTALVALIEEWGLTAEIGDRLVQARAGVPVAQLLADGEVDLGFQQLSELAGQPGIRILGVLPRDCAIDTVFAGAVAAASAEPDAALRVLASFAAPEAASVVRARNFDLPG